MGRGGDQNVSSQYTGKEESSEGVQRYYSWSQVKDSRNKWIVINDTVYDISKFYKKHPGGERLMLNHIGQDVTVMKAFCLHSYTPSRAGIQLLFANRMRSRLFTLTRKRWAST